MYYLACYQIGQDDYAGRHDAVVTLS